MDVAIDEAWGGIHPIAIDFLFAFIGANAGDPFVRNRDIDIFLDLRGENVDEVDVFDDQIGFDVAVGRLNQLAELFFIHISPWQLREKINNRRHY